MTDLRRLAELIRARNAIDAEIGSIVGRPALAGHVGEFIAATVFGIALEPSATNKSYDGRFVDGPLKDRTVNIKWYGKLEGLLDMVVNEPPDYYLVLTGPKSTAQSSRGGVRPLCINSVFLFDARQLLPSLRVRGVKIGIATSVTRALWEAAEVFPVQRSTALVLSDEQRELLELFAC